MKFLLPAIIALTLTGSAIPGPPEPIAPPQPPSLLLESQETLESLKAQLEIMKGSVDKRLKDIQENLDRGLEISKIAIAGDSIVITLSNDSVLVYSDSTTDIIGSRGKDVLRVGGYTVIEENETVYGDIVSVFGDVTVKGTVEGGVLAFSGNIYVASTGYIKDGAVALSGIVKQEPGARVGTMVWGANYPVQRPDFEEKRPYKIMGYVLFLVFIIWMILAATGASIFRKNVSTVVEAIKANVVISFLKGYLAYLLLLIAFIVLSITILGIPLALLGIPIAALAGMILSFTAISNILGGKILHIDEYSFKTFIYGSLALATLPGLFFFALMLTGSLVIMIFCWIFVFLFIFIIVPIGLGAVLSTRFGNKQPDNLAIQNKPGQAV